jgi:hypothetical protein
MDLVSLANYNDETSCTMGPCIGLSSLHKTGTALLHGLPTD